jgi:hypothetical protein
MLLLAWPWRRCGVCLLLRMRLFIQGDFNLEPKMFMDLCMPS